jgi:hypothetical protein
VPSPAHVTRSAAAPTTIVRGPAAGPESDPYNRCASLLSTGDNGSPMRPDTTGPLDCRRSTDRMVDAPRVSGAVETAEMADSFTGCRRLPEA